MKKSLILSILLLSGKVYAESNDTDGLQQILAQCETCHGVESKIHSIAPTLDGMQAWYLKNQLYNFRYKYRGFASLNEITVEMIHQAESLNEEQISLVANYYSGLDRLFSRATVTGNTQNGEILYQEHCEGCHSSIFGRFFTNSPQITHLEGPYLLAQLKLFSKGKRLFTTEDKHKIKMVEVAKRFSNEELSDIVAYIKSRSH